MANAREPNDVPIFVDLQGFIVNNNFYVKEVAVLRQGEELTHHVFRAPLPWNMLTREEKLHTTWLTTNFHNLHWKDGDVEYRQAKKMIKRAVLDGLFDGCDEKIRIYVKGIEKKYWLQRYLGDDHECEIKNIEIDYEEIDRLRDLRASRPFHCRRHVKNCAMENVIKLHEWWTQRKRQEFPLLATFEDRRKTRDVDNDYDNDDDDNDDNARKPRAAFASCDGTMMGLRELKI